MILHLLRHDLGRHRVIYPVASALIFVLPITILMLNRHTRGEWPMVAGLQTLFPLIIVVVLMMMRSTPWLDDRAFWRSRPVTAGQLFIARSLEIGLVVGLPLLAAMLTILLPLHLGLGVSALGVLQPLLLAVALCCALAAAHASASAGGHSKANPYLAAFVVPFLSVALLGWSKMHFNFGPRGLNEAHSASLAALLFAAAGAASAWFLVGRKLHRKAATLVLLVTAALFPWIAGSLRAKLIRPRVPDTRTLSIEVLPRPAESRTTPLRFGDLGDNEFFAPAHIGSSWQRDGRHIASTWPLAHTRHSGFHHPRPDQTQEPISRYHYHFAAAADIGDLWQRLRRQVPETDAWHHAEAHPRLREPIRLPTSGIESLDARGWIHRFVPLTPIQPVVPGPIDLNQPGRFDLIDTIVNGPIVSIDFSLITPDPAFDERIGGRWIYPTEPPEFWAILFHPQTRTGYAAHSLWTERPGSTANLGVAQSRTLRLGFRLPELEIALLGSDPKKILAESTLYLFHAKRIAWANAQGAAPCRCR